MKRKTLVSSIVSVGLSGGALYLALRNVPLSQLVNYMGSIRLGWVVPSALLVWFTFILRGFRWRIILQPSRRLDFWPVYHPLMIGFMINCILPGRIGEVARPAILYRRERVPFTTGLATVATERVMDAAMLILFLVAVMCSVKIRPDIALKFGSHTLNRDTLVSLGNGLMRLSLVLLAGIVLVAIDATRMRLIAMIRWLSRAATVAGEDAGRWVERRIVQPLVGILANVAEGFRLLKDPARLFACLVLTGVIWFLSAVAYYLVALGCPGIHLNLLELGAVMIIICFFIALPSVPGFWGIWEAGGVFALALFGIGARDAAGYTLINHAVQVFPVILAGLASAVVTGVNIRQAARVTDPGHLPPPSTAGNGA